MHTLEGAPTAKVWVGVGRAPRASGTYRLSEGAPERRRLDDLDDIFGYIFGYIWKRPQSLAEVDLEGTQVRFLTSLWWPVSGEEGRRGAGPLVGSVGVWTAAEGPRPGCNSGVQQGGLQVVAEREKAQVLQK